MNSEDNKLTDEKIDECKKIFGEFDRNNDGTISILELGEALRLIGCKPKDSELNQIIKEFDEDNSGFIEFQEFLHIVSINISESNTEEELLEALKILDRDQDGMIACSDLMLLMTTVGERLSEEEAEEIIKEIDPKGEGFIKYADLMRIRAGNKLI